MQDDGEESMSGGIEEDEDTITQGFEENKDKLEPGAILVGSFGGEKKPMTNQEANQELMKHVQDAWKKKYDTNQGKLEVSEIPGARVVVISGGLNGTTEVVVHIPDEYIKKEDPKPEPVSE